MKKLDNYDENNSEEEDTTKYGELIPSYFGWLTLDKQKQRAKELENIKKSKSES